LRHAITDGFATTELDLFAVAARLQREVFFHLNDQGRVGQAHAVAHGGAKGFGISAFVDVGHVSCLVCARVECALGQTPKAVHHTVARIVHQLHCALLARLKAHGHARGDVQAHALCGSAVKAQARVGLGKVVVRAHLDRAVAGVLHHQRAGAAAHIQSVLAGIDQKFTGDHGGPHFLPK
jgi:hypothetical protein